MEGVKMEEGKYDLDDLKEDLMEGVTPKEIENMDLEWCVAKWYLLTANVHGGLFAAEVFEAKALSFGEFYGALRGRIEALGGKVASFKSIELPKKAFTES